MHFSLLSNHVLAFIHGTTATIDGV